MAEPILYGVIGGSGLYKMAELTVQETLELDTPFGRPSAPVIVGTLRGQRVAFIPRHGSGHRYSPSEVPYRANIYALKSLGVRYVIGVSACGSLREDYAPGHIVIPDQLFDFTRAGRERSFFGSGLVAHVSVANPFSPPLSQVLYNSVLEVGGTAHLGGTFITVEGPRFSTRGESNVFRAWGMSIIGMTTSPEAFLAREAEMHYAVMAHVTDYDVWHKSAAPVTVEMVIATMNSNLDVAQHALAVTIEKLAAQPGSAYAEVDDALATAFMTDRSAVSQSALDRLDLFTSRYFGA